MSLLQVALNTLKWPLLAVVTPRACLIALSFSQPFLINRAIKLSEEPITKDTTHIGYGMIGAYILVYTGMAVCLS
jgi:ATP-binding cassette, subfamily C (CFTR/MRP), member 1